MMRIELSDGTGFLEREPAFPSALVPSRMVDIWLPPGYDTSTTSYPVLYMHDGQNLFDPALAYVGVDWGIDEAISDLAAEGVIEGAIVVGIWNVEGRRREYMPQRPLAMPESRAALARFSKLAGGPPWSDRYLQFIVAELKPWVDAHYRTLTDPIHTTIMGSSLGGLISLYALNEYPEVFGRAGCISTHWPAGKFRLVTQMGIALPRAGRHRLYFDHGDATFDAPYAPYQRRMDEYGWAAGYVQGVDWLSLSFPGADHSERSWRARVRVPLQFLLRT